MCDQFHLHWNTQLHSTHICCLYRFVDLYDKKNKQTQKPNKPSQRQVPISGTGNDTRVKELITVVLGLFVPHGISRCSHTLQLQYHHSYLTIISSLITNDSFPSLSFVSNRSRIIIAIPHWVISMTACFFPLFACWRIQLDNSHLYSLTVWDEFGMVFEFSRQRALWGGSKGVINFPWIFYAMRSLVPFGNFRNISVHLFTWLVCGSFQGRHGLLFTGCIVWDDEDKVIGFKRSHWIHWGWRSTGSPKLQLFQLSQHSQVTSCRLISISAYFPWNMAFKSKMKLSEGSWNKILLSKSRTQFFGRKNFFWWFVCRSDRPKFRK